MSDRWVRKCVSCEPSVWDVRVAVRPGPPSLRQRPARAAPLRSTLAAALIGAAAFQVATAGYAYYLARWGNVTSLDGPLGATLGFLLVVYVGVLVLLIGAELVAAWPKQDTVER